MTTGYDAAVAELRAEQERALAQDRKRLILFALESVAGDGFPRVSEYTASTLVAQGLVAKQPGDKLGRYRLTPEGRIMLAANPTESDEPTLFEARS